MARKSEWATKVLALLAANRPDNAIAQIKVAPSLRDLAALRTALARPPLAGRWPAVESVAADATQALSSPRLHRSP